MRSGFVPPALAILGVVVLLNPAGLLQVATAEPWEVEVMRWAGFLLIGLAPMWSWAMRLGGGPARRLRGWVRAIALAGVAYVVTTNPLFVVLGFSLVAGGLLDAVVERSSMASIELLKRLQAEET